VNNLRAALHEDKCVTLDVAALEMASIEYADLRPARYLDSLDRMAADLNARVSHDADGASFVEAANQYLFGELGFAGNEKEYYDPRNSCMNDVLDRRTGIPITLSVIYMEIARRLNRPVFGVGLPGHFVALYDDGDYATYIDPYHGGKLLGESDCRNLVQEIAGAPLDADPRMLRPVANSTILLRMLNNLRSAYFRADSYGKAIDVLDLLVEASPGTGEFYRSRGVAKLKLRAYGSARADLEMYLTRSPGAHDADKIKKQLEAIHRWLGARN